MINENQTILIVDDVPSNIQVAMNILKEDDYQFVFATSGEEALRLVGETELDLILLDIMMPGIDGYEVCKRLKASADTSDIPIIFLTAKVDIDSVSKAFSLGGCDYITKPFHPIELLSRVKTHIEVNNARKLLKSSNRSLEHKLHRSEERLLSELESNQIETIFVLTELMESTSDETGRHISRIAEASKLLADLTPSLNEDDSYLLYHASPMHDIGKIAVPREILNKPGALSSEEFDLMKRHTSHAHNYLRRSKRRIICAADVIAHQHHEKIDGTGYPQGLKEDEIHVYGRIVAIVDVFDALTHKRVYKDQWTVAKAAEYIVDNAGTHFDPEFVGTFKNNVKLFAELL